MDEASATYGVSTRRLSSSGSDDGETSYGDDDVRGVYEVCSPYLYKFVFSTNSRVSDVTAIYL